MHLWTYSPQNTGHHVSLVYSGPDLLSSALLIYFDIFIFWKIFRICKLYKTLKNTLHKQVSDKTYMTKLLENHESVIPSANLQAGDDWVRLNGKQVNHKLLWIIDISRTVRSVRPVMEDPIHIRHLVSLVTAASQAGHPADKN